jgi:hypothetical protein
MRQVSGRIGLLDGRCFGRMLIVFNTAHPDRAYVPLRGKFEKECFHLGHAGASVPFVSSTKAINFWHERDARARNGINTQLDSFNFHSAGSANGRSPICCLQSA